MLWVATHTHPALVRATFGRWIGWATDSGGKGQLQFCDGTAVGEMNLKEFEEDVATLPNKQTLFICGCWQCIY
jgi:hypothetical protein